MKSHLRGLVIRGAPMLRRTLFFTRPHLLSFATDTAASVGKSQRQQFRDTPVDPSILKYITSIGVGIPPRRRKNRRNDGTTDENANNPTSWKVPLPFGPNALPVRVIASVSAVNTLDENMGFPPVHKERPEIAFIGRSNVGKSTLLNTLLYANRNENRAADGGRAGRRSRIQTIELPKGIKAVTSNKPGETKQVTFYHLSSGEDSTCRLCLVDLPGYGFAYASEETKKTVDDLIFSFLKQRQGHLKRILLLIDARHGMKKADIDFLTMLEDELVYKDSANIKKKTLPPIQVVLTKCDLVHQGELARRCSCGCQNESRWKTLRWTP
ncbi:GTP-binding protein [Fistulifera solaris]|uniref:GTP-binding protein n=1 Tax=Fistulifera solaris TaxID=1519565 RepID=A0A1Z5J7J0_FISSO|nr:GTP-binding protein [Fistulifera solaris]|eukprot:GAX09882.1 GTP-binding protein [Fistulifera solaris]